MMRILMTGGTGLIGSCFIQRFSASHDFTVLARKPQAAARKLGKNVRVLASLSELEHLDLFDAVINLAGEPIADKRWSDAQKERIQNSRWQTTQKLVSLIQASARPPRIFISGSAIGYYGRQGSEPVTETQVSRMMNLVMSFAPVGNKLRIQQQAPRRVCACCALVSF